MRIRRGCILNKNEVSSEYFDKKEVSSIDAWGRGIILGSINFTLCKASRRIGEECMLQSKKIFNFMKSSWEELGVGFLKDEDLSMRLRMNLWLWKEGAIRINFKMLWKDELFLEGVNDMVLEDGWAVSFFVVEFSCT